MGICRVSGEGRMMDLAEAFESMRAPLESLGIEIGTDVLALWRDRDAHGRDPLPPEALKRLRETIEQILSGGD